MSRYIDADALIADMQERLCKPCKADGKDYHEVACRACWVDDAMGEIDLAPTIQTKEIKYYDDDEHVWKIGRVIVDA